MPALRRHLTHFDTHWTLVPPAPPPAPHLASPDDMRSYLARFDDTAGTLASGFDAPGTCIWSVRL